jgi:general secretion pathway protein G
MSPAGKMKTSATALWSLIFGISGLLGVLYRFFSLGIGFGLPIIVVVSVFVSFALGMIGLILGIISLSQIIWHPGGPKGLGFAIGGLIISAAVISFIAPGLPPGPDPSRNGIAKIQISELESAIQAFREDTLRYPTTAEGLDALMHISGNLKGWNGPYVIINVPPDAWGRPYHYCHPGVHNPDGYDLWSDGKDGIEGTKDDIANFK